jgi:hypothetical protein
MVDGEGKVNIRTDTGKDKYRKSVSLILFYISAWATKEIKFLLGSHFSVNYEAGGRGGTLEYYCHRPQHNIINCR